jgi:hypothetical protein
MYSWYVITLADCFFLFRHLSSILGTGEIWCNNFVGEDVCSDDSELWDCSPVCFISSLIEKKWFGIAVWFRGKIPISRKSLIAVSTEAALFQALPMSSAACILPMVLPG